MRWIVRHTGGRLLLAKELRTRCADGAILEECGFCRLLLAPLLALPRFLEPGKLLRLCLVNLTRFVALRARLMSAREPAGLIGLMRSCEHVESPLNL